MNVIPRIQLTLPLGDLLAFLINLCVPKSQPEQTRIISDFESQFSRRYNLPPGVCFSKARVAFYFLLKNMGLKQGGEVLISAIHVADFVNMIRLAGFKPVVVDLLPGTYTMDEDDLEKKITERSALILITHLSGYVPDMDRIIKISERYNVPFIEDCSQAVSSQYNGQALGVFGRAAIFSLSFLKSICTISGGYVLSSDLDLLNRLKHERTKLRKHPKGPLVSEAIKNIIIKLAVQPLLFHWIVFPLLRLTLPLGDYFSKYQKTNKTVILRESMPKDFLVNFTWQQAVMGLSQLSTLEQREKARIAHAAYLYDHLKKLPHISLPPLVKGSSNSFWLFPILVQDTNKAKRFFVRYGIDSSKFLLSLLSEEEVFREYNFKCESAKHIKDHTLFIPMYCHIMRDQLDHIIKIIGSYHAMCNGITE
jgi:dTDP-4-amino-4,6-dideoxygalactose transaminase